MKLPTKREYASRSMASAMRSPVLEQKPERYRAATTKFVPMPTDYNAVGNAQARAALAEGDAWAAMGTAFNKVLDVAGQINEINNTTRQKAREAELLSRLSEYMSEADSRDMHVPDAKGVYGYTTEKARLQKFLKDTEAELDQLYKFDNAAVAENYRIRRQGIYSSAFEQLDTLIDAAEDKRSRGDLAIALSESKDIATLKSHMPTAIAVYGQEGALEAYLKNASRIASDDNFDYLLQEEDSSNNNLVRDRIQQIKDGTLENYADASPDVKMAIIKTLEARLVENRGKMWEEMGNLGSADEIREYFEYGQTIGVFGGDYSGDVASMEAKISEFNYSQSSRAIDQTDVASLPDLMASIKDPNNIDVTPNQKIALERQYEERVRTEAQDMAQDLVSRLELLGKQEQDTVEKTYKPVKAGAQIVDEYLKIEKALNASDPTEEQKAIRVSLGLDPNNPSPSAVEVSKNALRSVIDGAQTAELAAADAGSKLTHKTNVIRAAASSTSALNNARIGDNDIIVKNSGEIYENWRDQQLASFQQRVAGTNPHADPVPPPEEELLLTWMSETRLAPNTVVERLTQAINVGRNPNDKDIVQVSASLVMLNSMLDAVPEMVNQEGLNSAGVQEAMELARFLGNRTADPELWKEFLDAKQRMQSDKGLAVSEQVKGYQSEMSNWKNDSKTSTGKFAEWFTAIRANNPHLPTNMPPEMYEEMYALVGIYGATSPSGGWAYDKAFAHVMSSGRFGIENNFQLDEDGNWVVDENNPTRFKKHSIYAMHEFSPGMSTEAQKMTATGAVVPGLRINIFGGTVSQDGNELAKFNPIQVTINDIAKMSGVEPESLDTLYMTSADGGEYWILTRKGSDSHPLTLPMDHPDYKKMESLHKQDPETYPAPPYVIKIFKNSLSYSALESQTRIDNQTAYDNSKASYEEWEEAVAIGRNTETDLFEALGSGAKNWALQMFGGSQFNQNNIVPPSLSPTELHRIETLRHNQMQHEEGSVEYEQYKNMQKLVASDMYRLAVMNGEEKLVRDLEAMTKQVTADWVMAREKPRMYSGSMPPIVDMRVNVINTNYK